MGKYANDNDVLLRLQGKVRVTDDPEGDEGLMTSTLFRRLETEAESQLEFDLSERYAAPFAAVGGAAYETLPDSPTKNTIRRLATLLTVVYVLDTDFGRGTIVDGDKYKESQQKQYDKIIERLLEKRDVGGPTGQWRYPPLPGLQLAAHNEVADDGFYGSVLVTTQGDGDYPKKQINDPSETFFGGKIDP